MQRVPSIAAGMLLAALAACGGGPTGASEAARAPRSATTDTTTMTAAAAAPTTEAPPLPTSPASLALVLDEYAISPPASTVGAGRIVVDVVNADRAPHDVVLLRTALAPDQLPTVGITVDEGDPAVEVVARTARLEPGGTGEMAATLVAGTYVLVCSVPHHYVRERMVATLSVPG